MLHVYDLNMNSCSIGNNSLIANKFFESKNSYMSCIMCYINVL